MRFYGGFTRSYGALQGQLLESLILGTPYGSGLGARANIALLIAGTRTVCNSMCERLPDMAGEGVRIITIVSLCTSFALQCVCPSN